MQELTTILSKCKTILLYGYGVEGESTARFLKKNYPHIRLSIYDEKNPKYAKLTNPEKYDLTVVSPGVDRQKLSTYPQATLTSNTELFFGLLSEVARSKIIGITGTKGKSTTVKYLFELLTVLGFRVEVGGNYGTAMLEILDVINDCDYVVLELSSFQLENLSVSPHFAGFVSFYEDHLDRHHSRDEYFKAKSHIFSHQSEGDKLFVPEVYDTFLEPARSTFEAMVSDSQGRTVVTHSLPEDYFPSKSTLRSSYLRSNLGVVAEMARVIVSHDPEIEAKIRAFSESFVPLPHRLENVRELNGRVFINDSQSTNQYSTIAGMETFGTELGTLILGGKDKGNSYELLVDQIMKQQPFIVILDTEAGDLIKLLLEKNTYENYVVVDNFGDAIHVAYQMTEPGKYILLSPAAASFGWFENYKDRGDQFKKLVLELE